ncbi:MAG: MgtC/SapB family protein [Faecalibacterium sp.]
MNEFTSFGFQALCVLRLIFAAACGLCIGVERHNRLKEAGMRTHLLVCMGAALLMIVSKYGFFDVAPLNEFFKADVARIASNVVTGVSFLGAGTIFVRNRSITGLTTAAGIWVTAGIGLAMGAGLYLIALAGTIMIIAAQSILHNGRLIGTGMMSLILRIDGRNGTVSQTVQQLQSIGAELVDLDVAQKKNDIIKIEMRVKPLRSTDQLTVIQELEKLPWVLEVCE